MAGPATWHLLTLHPETVMMYGVFEHSQGNLLNYASVVTAVSMVDGRTILLGVEKIVWITDMLQQESLLNIHRMCNAGINIDNQIGRAHV